MQTHHSYPIYHHITNQSTISCFFDPHQLILSLKKKPCISLKFKGVILNGILERKPHPLRNVFLKWLTNSSNKYHRKAINKFISQNITKYSFFIKLKTMLNHQKAVLCEHNPNCTKNNIVNTEGSKVQTDNSQQPNFYRKTSILKNLIYPVQSNSKTKLEIPNTYNVIPSLRSIIEEKVFKKSKNKIQSSISQNRLDRSQTTSVIHFHSVVDCQQPQDNLIESQIVDSSISLPSKIRNHLKKLNVKTNSKINQTIFLVKQIAALHLECCLRGKNAKLKLSAWMVLKCSQDTIIQENSLYQIERQLQLINDNIEKDQLIMILANEVQLKAKEIQQIQQDFKTITQRMTKNYAEQFIRKISKCLFKFHKYFFDLVLRPNGINSTSGLLDGSHSFDSDSIVKYSMCDVNMKFDGDGLLSVKKIMQDNEQNDQDVN